MAWNTPITWVANQLVEALDMNQQISDNMNFLGGMEYDGVLVSALAAGTNLAKLQRLATHPIGFVGDLSQTSDVVLDGENIWLRIDGRTIGNAASSGADIADDNMLALFTVLWDNTDDTELPIQDSSGTPLGSRGASAAADWAANKRLPIWDSRGRVSSMMDDPTGADAADIVTDAEADALGGTMGAETHTLIEAELAAHVHNVQFRADFGGSAAASDNDGSSAIRNHNTDSAGSDGAHNNMQPTLFLVKAIYTGN